MENSQIFWKLLINKLRGNEMISETYGVSRRENFKRSFVVVRNATVHPN